MKRHDATRGHDRIPALGHQQPQGAFDSFKPASLLPGVSQWQWDRIPSLPSPQRRPNKK